jgi:hypothetical protein
MGKSIANCTNVPITACILIGIAILSTAAHAEPGDAQAVAQARKDYAEAMKGRDKGLQNAMRAQLSAQLAISRERAAQARKQLAPGSGQSGSTRPSDAKSPKAKSAAG